MQLLAAQGNLVAGLQVPATSSAIPVALKNPSSPIVQDAFPENICPPQDLVAILSTPIIDAMIVSLMVLSIFLGWQSSSKSYRIAAFSLATLLFVAYASILATRHFLAVYFINNCN
ncbi:MAG: hypothetical protein K1X79_05685 [Oligoflexia bacterium]|nr:hypothetical protein [Oligoflexia bacterium]